MCLQWVRKMKTVFWKRTQNSSLLMERNQNCNARFVRFISQQRTAWSFILHHFVINRNHTVVRSVITCNSKFAQKGHLKRHTVSVDEGRKPFQCVICDYSCSEKSSLKSHIESVHEGRKPFQCDTCDYNCSGNKHKISSAKDKVI